MSEYPDDWQITSLDGVYAAIRQHHRMFLPWLARFAGTTFHKAVYPFGPDRALYIVKAMPEKVHTLMVAVVGEPVRPIGTYPTWKAADADAKRLAAGKGLE